MTQITNINVGIDSIARTYIELNKDPESEPVIVANAGTTNSIKLFCYKLKDGSNAEEYIQMILPSNNGQNLYFLALKTKKRAFTWPSAKILKKISKYSLI